MNNSPWRHALRWTFALSALTALILVAAGGAWAWSLSQGDWPVPAIWINGAPVDLQGSLSGSAASVVVGLLVAAVVVGVMVLVVLPLVLVVAVGLPLLLTLLGLALAALALLGVGGLLLSPLLLLVLPLAWAWSRSRRPRHGGDNAAARMEPR